MGQLLCGKEKGNEHHNGGGAEQGAKLNEGGDQCRRLNEGPALFFLFLAGLHSILRFFIVVGKEGKNGRHYAESCNDILCAAISDGGDEGSSQKGREQRRQRLTDAEVPHALVEMLMGDDIIGGSHVGGRGGRVADALYAAADKGGEHHGDETTEEDTKSVEGAAHQHDQPPGKAICQQSVDRAAQCRDGGIHAGQETHCRGSTAQILRHIERENNVVHLCSGTKTNRCNKQQDKIAVENTGFTIDTH